MVLPLLGIIIKLMEYGVHPLAMKIKLLEIGVHLLVIRI